MPELEMRVRILRQCQEQLGLPYRPGGPEGSSAVLFGMLPFLRGPLQQSACRTICEITAKWTIPKIKIDPIGFALAAAPLWTPTKSQLPPAANLDGQSAMCPRAWNLYHIVLGPQCLKLLSETCTVNGINGSRPFGTDSALLHRVRQQAFHIFLEPRPATFPLVEAPRLLKEGMLLLSSVKPALIICNNWDKPVIHRRSSAPKQRTDGCDGQAISVPSSAVDESRRHLIAEAEKEEVRDRELLAQARARNSARGGSPGTRVSGAWTPAETFSALPPLRGITESQLAIIRDYAASRYGSESAALALAMTDVCALCDEDFSRLRLEIAGDGYLLWTPCPLLTSDHPDAGLHIQVSDGFYRFVPADLARALQRAIESNRLAGLLAARDGWLREQLSTTAAKVRHAFRFQVPIWDGMPWAYFDLGLVSVRYNEDGRPQMPGYRHYLTWRPQDYADWLFPAMARRGWRIGATAQMDELPACGSSHTPLLDVVRDMAECLRSLVAVAHHTPLGSLTPGETVSLVNSISALARLFECLFAFSRNYPCDAPAVIGAAGRQIIREKLTFRQEKIRLRPIAYPPCLVAALEEVATAYHGLCGSLEIRGYRLDSGDAGAEWRSSAFGFIDRGFAGQTLRLIKPRKAAIRAGLLHHSATERFGAIAQNCMRNLAYYLLAPTPEHQFVVMGLSDHFPGGTAGALSRDSGASIYEPQIQGAACNYMAQAISWPWR